MLSTSALNRKAVRITIIPATEEEHKKCKPDLGQKYHQDKNPKARLYGCPRLTEWNKQN